jgi:hypothetical protein
VLDPFGAEPGRHAADRRAREPAEEAEVGLGQHRVAVAPVSPPLGSPRESGLWKRMDACEEKTGGDVLALAHAGNVPNGRMFPLIQPFTDLSVDEACVEARGKSEPV